MAIIKAAFERQQVEKTNRLLHNLTSLNAHLIQDLYAFVSQESLSSTLKFKDQKKVVAERIQSAPYDAADTFLRVRKNATSMKNEFSAYRKLNDRNPILNFSLHAIHRVVLNVTNLFFSDFADKSVRLVMDPCELKVKIDYDSIQVAFYHLMDNATKYVKPDTELRVSFIASPRSLEVQLKMVSVHISADEVEKVFIDAYSGSYAKQSGLAGKGLGMGIVRDLLKLNHADIRVNAGLKLNDGFQGDDIPFADNVFAITFDNDIVFSPGNQSLRHPTVPKFRSLTK